MLRVVKVVSPIKLNNHWVYRVDDTILIKEGWRPEGYMDIQEKLMVKCKISATEVSMIWDACLKALGGLK